MIIIKSTHDYSKAYESLNHGKPVILPTDTNYNLACNPHSRQAVDYVYHIKNRGKEKPLSLFFEQPKDWVKYGQPMNKDLMKHLVAHFWPGPINLIVPKNNHKYDHMLWGGDTIALGCIKNETWREFMKGLHGEPVALTSANLSGANIDLVTEEIAKEQLGTVVDYLIQSKESINATRSSTMLLVEKEGVTILRHGDITKEEIKNVLCREGYYVREAY